MRDMERSNQGDSRLLISQVIIAAMMLGIVVIFFFSYAKGAPSTVDPQKAQVFSLMGLVFTVTALLATLMIHFVVTARGVRGLILRVRSLAREAGLNDEATSEEIYAKLATLHLMRVIMCGAMLEGAAMFLGIGYMLTRSPLSLGLGAFLALVLASMFPTRDRFERWIERQERIVRDETFAT